MISIQAALLALLLSMKYRSVQNQCWNGYASGSSWDPYAQSYNYPYGGYSAYDYSSAPTICITTYPQSSPYDYYQQSSYNTCPNNCQQPVVVVINGNNYDDDLCEVLSLAASLNKKPNNEPIYIPYPVPVPSPEYNNNNCGCRPDYGYSDCGCKCGGCGCSNSASCDCGCNCDCGECKKRRSKSKCSRNSGCGCSNSDCSCNKCIKHKNDRCCRGC